MLSSPERGNDSTKATPKPPKPIDEQRRTQTLKAIHLNEKAEETTDELAELGISLEDAYSDSETHNRLVEADDDEANKNQNNQNIEINQSIQNRFAELQKTETSVASILTTLQTEFADSLDKETAAVLDQYSALLSPELIADKKELEAVETLFYTQSCDFTGQSFGSFIGTIYDEPDSIISEETKQKIEQKFRIPRIKVNTGAELAAATAIQDPDGNPVFDSPQSALSFRPGMKTYMKDENHAILIVEGNSQAAPLSIPPEMLADSTAVAELSNYALIRQMVYEELRQLTNLFGGGAEDEIGQPSPESIRQANRFAKSLIGKYPSESILEDGQLNNLRIALKALRNPSHIGESHSHESMQTLGLLDNGKRLMRRLFRGVW